MSNSISFTVNAVENGFYVTATLAGTTIDNTFATKGGVTDFINMIIAEEV